MAILATGSRVDLLQRIEVPSLVIHGRDDPLVPLACGADTAEHIPGAEIKIIDGMGHYLAPNHIPAVVKSIAGHCNGSQPV